MTETDSQGVVGDQAEWPDWRISAETVAELARYVSPAQVATWMPTELLTPLPSGGNDLAQRRSERAKQLYESLAARRIPYADVQWNPAAYDQEGMPAFQRIRTPEETVQGPATCLDLAVIFAAMAIEADLRPLIAIRCEPSWHAVVVLDLRGTAMELGGSQSAAGEPASEREMPGFTPRPGEPGVRDQAQRGGMPLIRLAQVPELLPVNVVEAARNYGTEFAEASGLNAARTEDSDVSDWMLVDVRQAQVALGSAPYEPPRGRSAPPIHGYLPTVTGFREFNSRSGIFDRLQRVVDAGKPATIVIQAPSGYGKSMLAHRLATGADNGCGWFLNATDVTELERSLAQAEHGEHALGGERPRPGGEKADADEDRAFAGAALERLRAAERPWVVVVDNCDSPADTPGLADRIPKPHAPGQVVIVTTTGPDWLAYATDDDCRIELAGIGDGDLRVLRLPGGLSVAVGGRPLVALALTALRDRGGVELPETSDLDGPELVWELLRRSPRVPPEAVELARLLAWLPPEPMPVRSLLKIVAWDASPADTLAELGFITRSASAVPGLSARAAAADSLGLLMHRLFAAAVREQTWRDVPDAAADSIARLLTTDEGRWLFITAADVTALARLEPHDEAGELGGPGDVKLAVRQLTGHPRPEAPVAGLLWYGLGHVRERRGPVRASKIPFRNADELLDPASHPYEVAESRVGLARVAFQDPRAADLELASARDAAWAAQRLLVTLDHPDARQLSEQGNALAWLIERRLAGREADLALREARLTEIRANLWSSFAERLRIARSQPADTPVASDAVPLISDGLGPERAFFNLAGADIILARLRHELAQRQAEAAGRELKVADELLKPADESFRAAEHVYNVVRELREQRYGGRPHPHLAACLHGLAIAGYYQAALLGEVGKLAGAAENAAAGLQQRLQIAGSLSSAGAVTALRDGDVRKSFDLLFKITAGAALSRSSELASGSQSVAELMREAIKEWTGGPGRLPPDNQPAETEPNKTPSGRVVGEREAPAGFVRDAPRRSRPRYLSASYPDAVQPGANFGLEVAVVLSRGAGSKDTLMGLEVGPGGKQLKLSIYARGLTVRGDHEQPVFVPADADSSPVRFELAGTQVGVHPIRLRAWDQGSCVGELWAEVIVSADARGGTDQTLTGQIEATAISGEITLEVSHEFSNGQNYYQFRFRDPETEPAMVTLPLRRSPDADVNSLIVRLNQMAKDPGSKQENSDALRQEGMGLWDRMVPPAVQEQFWQCRERIGQLTILSYDDAFPWELLYPRDKVNDAGFLVAQGFPVTRRLHGFKRQLGLRRHPARFVVPPGAPPRAEAEVNAIRELLGARDPNISTLRELQDLINSGGFGVLHFACHGNFSWADQGPQIDLDRPFLGRALEDAQDNWQAPLVFLNACRSAGPRYRCIGLHSFAEEFLRAGAGAFVGSLWDVRDDTASVFAERLYTGLQSPDATLGRVVAKLRQNVIKDGDDPTWLAYAVYGHPEAKLL